VFRGDASALRLVVEEVDDWLVGGLDPNSSRRRRLVVLLGAPRGLNGARLGLSVPEESLCSQLLTADMGALESAHCPLPRA